jgi:uncharacterized RDD family membrane protein YckC
LSLRSAPVARLDTLAEVETPEGITLSLRPAGPMPRSMAWVIDFAIRLGLFWLLAIIAAFLQDAGQGVLLISLFLLMWGYPILFEVLRGGQTPGKRALGLKVVHQNGTPVGWLASIVRNLLRTVDILPLGYGFGLVATLLDRHSRRIGDLVAGTLVIHAEAEQPHAPAPPVPPIASPVPLTPAEQAAIVAFAERARLLSPERQQELADTIAPALGLGHGPAAVGRVYGLAAAILGRRG